MATFFDLPGELRNYIYELHVDDHIEVDIVTLYDRRHLPRRLARVSRQIREEFLSVWDIAPREITSALDLEVCVKDLDLELLTAFFNGAFEVPEYLESVRITFLFTDASKIAPYTAAAQKWSARDFACWNDMDLAADPKVTITADFDWKSFEAIGVPTMPRRQATFNAQPTFLEEIVRKAKDVKWGQPPGRGLRERIFLAWLMGQVCASDERDRRRARVKEESDRRRATEKEAEVTKQGMKRKRLEEDPDGVEETWDEG